MWLLIPLQISSVFKWLLCLKAQSVPVLSMRAVNAFFPPKTQCNFVMDVCDAIRFWEAVLAQGIYNSRKKLVLVTFRRVSLFLVQLQMSLKNISLQFSSLDFIKMNSKPKVKLFLHMKMKNIWFWKWTCGYRCTYLYKRVLISSDFPFLSLVIKMW